MALKFLTEFIKTQKPFRTSIKIKILEYMRIVT